MPDIAPQMKTPGPDHPITVAAHPKRVQVSHQGHVIADTRRALVLSEAGYKPVIYVPREDAAMEYFTRTDRVTFCPYKGQANYYTLLMDGRFADNAVWTYEEPYPAVDVIRGHLAFYPNQVEFDVLDEPAFDPATVILHTDEGDGASQKEPWPPSP